MSLLSNEAEVSPFEKLSAVWEKQVRVECFVYILICDIIVLQV